jgi:PAS domain S-box-containing protein
MIKKTILIVDDTFENLYLLRVILEGAGYHVIEARDGSEGLKKLYENNTVDLIISDILMPIMDGFLFCQACKKEKLFKNIPFVFYTSTYTEKLDEDFALKLGAAKFLRKPIDYDEIILTVKNIFGEVNKPIKSVKNSVLKNEDVFKLYNERLINKLEHKSLELEKEIVIRKKAETLLIQKNEILDLIAHNTPLNQVLDHILLNYESIHPNYYASISLLHEDGIHLELTSAPSMPEAYNLAIKRIVIGKNVGSCGAAAFTKKLVIVSDISKDKLWEDNKDIALKHSLKSCWSMPILSKSNEVLGTFAIYGEKINTPKSEEIEGLKYTVNLAFIAIEKAKIVAEIKKRDELYRSLVNQASDAIVTYSLEGEIFDFNKPAYTVLGYSKKEFSKLKIQDIVVGDIILSQDRYEIILRGKPVIFERQLISKNGTLVDVELSVKLQKDGKILGIIRDITERKKAELELKRAKEYSESLIESMHEGLVVYDKNTDIISVNPSFCEMSGFSEKELIGQKHPYSFCPPEIETESKLRHKTAAKGDILDNFSSVYMRKDGSRFNVDVMVSYINDSEGNMTAYFGTVIDTTERRKAEIDLLESEKSLSEAQKRAKIGSFNLNLKTQIAETSSSFKEIIGIDANSILTFDLWRTITHPDDTPNNQKVLEKSIETGNKFELEYRIITKDKQELKWIHGLGEIVFKNGEATNFIGTIQDITESKQAEIALKSSKEFTDKLIMSMQEGLLIVNLAGKIIDVNVSFCEILGYLKEELIGLSLPYPFAKTEDFELMSEVKKGAAKGTAKSFQLEFIRKNGEKFIASFLSGSIKDDNGQVIALFGTVKDISEEEKAKKVLEDIAIKSTQRKNAIMELSALVGSDYHKSLKQITALASETLNVGRVGIWKFIDDRNSVLCEKLYVSKTSEYEEGKILNRSDNPNYFAALTENQTINVEDAVTNDITKGFAKDYLIPSGVSSILDVFIQGKQGAYGVISFEHIGSRRNWTADDEEFATSMANVVTLMVESAERKLAEKNLVLSNEELFKANNELNLLRNQLVQENIYLRNELDLVFNYEEMVYGSEAFSDVLSEVEKVAPTNATVLLLGESGTGKELLARAVHNISLRNNKPLIKVNCSAIPRELMESELFGHKKGSFTGAFADKVGKFELADGGTLFLDEIGELPLDMQPKILRFLQEGEIEVVGGAGLKKLDVRVIAATNRNLKEEIEKKQFREDLYFRLNVFPIEIPPLRKRKEDIPLLVEHFIDKFNKSYAKNIKYLSEDSMSQLKSYEWPGNIRELENLIERASILSTNETLLIPGFESKNQKSKSSIRSNTIDLSLDLAQRNHILQILEQCHWKISGPNGAAVLLDLKPSTLRDKMAKLDIVKPLKK